MADSETKTITAQVSSSLLEEVDKLAARQERSRDWVINEALATWLSLEEEDERLTREAMAEIDAGLVVDHEEVQAWADSLGTDHPLPLPLPLPKAR
jgi:predicted transcriptional regulator